MRDSQSTRTLLLTTAGIMCAAVAIAAQAQTASPFAKKKKKQAWEIQIEQEEQAQQSQPAPSAPAGLRTGANPAGTYVPPANTPPRAAPPAARKAPAASAPMAGPSSSSPAPSSTPAAPTIASSAPRSSYRSSYGAGSAPTIPYNAPQTSTVQSQPAAGATVSSSASSRGGVYAPRTYGGASSYQGSDAPSAPASSYAGQPSIAGASASEGQGYYNYQPAPQYAEEEPLPEVETLSGRPHYPGRPNGGQMRRAPAQGPNQGGYAPRNAPQGTYMPQQGPNQAPQSGPMQQPKPQTWKDRLGFGSLLTTISGYLRLGAAATQRDVGGTGNDWSEDFIADGMARGEVSAVTYGGLEYGAGLEVRGQYDKYRRGFGGRVGDCPPTIAGCPSVLIGGTPTATRGHTSQFYASGADNAKEAEFALEGAYLFLRSAYGDLTVGRDDGAAYLFSLGAPTLLAVGASNSPVDYTGLDAVKTVNDASGFSEKITYTSPRLLGDTVGVGVQIGASYSLDSKACGVDYCVRTNGKDGSGAVSPDLEDMMEVGLSLDRKFDNGFSVEATATYAIGSEKSNNAAFEDLEALGLGVELGYNDFTLGGSYLNSNNGLANGAYTSWDTGLTWKPNKLGFTLGYGHAKDKNVNLKSDQAVFGVTYDWRENVRFGTGVQHIQRKTNYTPGGVVTPTKEKATSIFVEGRVTF